VIACPAVRYLESFFFPPTCFAEFLYVQRINSCSVVGSFLFKEMKPSKEFSILVTMSDSRPYSQMAMAPKDCKSALMSATAYHSGLVNVHTNSHVRLGVVWRVAILTLEPFLPWRVQHG